jgi:hypothetical protein
MSSLAKYFIAGVILLTGIYGCVKKKTYTNIPAIEFKSFIIRADTAADLTITFTDGDGDIGREADDNTYNLYMTYYYYDPTSGKFVARYSQSFNDTIRNPAIIRRPKDYQPGKPISGEITENISSYRHSVTVKRLKYVVYIFDNAGHKSNMLVTPEIAAP